MKKVEAPSREVIKGGASVTAFDASPGFSWSTLQRPSKKHQLIADIGIPCAGEKRKKQENGTQSIMKRYEIDEEWADSRLDRFIKHIEPAVAFPAIQILLRKGKIKVNGRKARGSMRLKKGDVVCFHLSDSGERGVEERRPGKLRKPSKLKIGRDIPILFEDDSILVLDKPAGIPVQPGNRKEKGSLLDLLSDYQATSGKGGESSFPYTPVHRLDIETSGLLIVAKNRRAARTLSRFFRDGEINKVYLAVVEGVTETREGTITSPLIVEKGRSSRVKTLRSNDSSATESKAVAARTTYRVLKELEGNRALVEVTITTGRTHQIRVHLASIGLPVLGDARYGTARKNKAFARGGEQSGLRLHAWKLSFIHPVTGEKILLQSAPPWLEDMEG